MVTNAVLLSKNRPSTCKGFHMPTFLYKHTNTPKGVFVYWPTVYDVIAQARNLPTSDLRQTSSLSASIHGSTNTMEHPGMLPHTVLLNPDL